MTNAIPQRPPNRVFSRETERNLAALEDRITTLTVLCESLAEERQTLAAEHSELGTERDALATENQHVRTRIDAMVARLRGLEEDS